MRRRIIALFTLIMVLTSTVGVLQPALAEFAPVLLEKTAAVQVKSVSMSVKSKTLYVGDSSYQAVANVEPAGATNPALTWKSSNTKIAKVSSTGEITPVKAGAATITATAKDGSKKKASIKVTVKNVTPKSILLSETKITLMPGEKATLIPTISPSNATSKSVTWSTSSKSKATVSKSGVVTAKKAGTVKITATTKSGKKKAVCTVTVLNDKPSSVALDATKKTAYVGDKFSLTATVKPSYAKNKSVTWSSSNKKIATVSSKGVVTAKKAGTVKITVKTKSGSKKKTCTVTVKPIAVTSVSLNHETYALKPKGKVTLKTTVLPANATTKTVTWSSSNKKIATVSSKGVVTAKKNGTVTIQAKTKSGSKVAKCTIYVTKTGKIEPTGVTMSHTQYPMDAGDTLQLAAVVAPSNASDKTVTWSSTNSSIASVDSTGKVTAKAAGIATITAKTNTGGHKATCKVTVTAEVMPTTVTLSDTALRMGLNATHTLTATVGPTNATDKSVKWSSSDVSIATVSNAGVVTTKKAGTVTITATTNRAGRTGKCTITVVNEKTPETVRLTYAQYTMYSATTVQLAATISPSDAVDKSITWQSSNMGVATVDGTGLVSAKAPGKAVITVTTNTGGRTAICEITVNQKTDTTVYRAYMIGNENYPGDASLQGPKLDVQVMKAVLTNGQYKSENVYDYYNLRTSEMQDVLRLMQSHQINDNDVTLFYYSGHGLSSTAMPGALMGVEYSNVLSVSQVQTYLDAVPGTVIVILDSCISGQFIQSKAVMSKFSTAQSEEESVRAFNKACLEAFGSSSVRAKALPDSQYSGKYKILTAASYQNGHEGLSYSSPAFSSSGEYIGVFTNFFVNGAGYYPFATSKVTAAMPADTNGDSAVTLAEMYSYTASRVSSYVSSEKTKDGKKLVQNVMVYPGGDKTALVKKK